MTPTEIKAALKELDGSIGNRGICGVRVSLYTKEPLAGSISCNSLGISIDVEADEWAELFAKLRSAWAKARADGERGLIKKMALAIIRLTEERGECTDQMLRVEFGAGDVTAFMDRAVEMADKMATNGPFAVRRVLQSNAA